MRLAVLVAALFLSLGASASASSWPPPPVPQTFHVIRVGHIRTHAAQTRACMSREARAKIARWLAPVACEQPPKSEVLIPVLLGG